VTPAHQCCCTEDDCCEAASRSWPNALCLDVSETITGFSRCDCSCCENLQQDCQECTENGNYCCFSVDFRWCIRGTLFRMPRTLPGSEDCDPAQSSSTYDPCPDPWSTPNWPATEGGENSYYTSPVSSAIPPGKCTTAPDWARVRYHCRFTVTHDSGNCDSPDPLCSYDALETFDDAYTVEGRAQIYCVGEACATGQGPIYEVCDCDEVNVWDAPMHILKIEPIETPANNAPRAPTMYFAAKLGLNQPPHTATWELLHTEGYINQSYGGPVWGDYDHCDPAPGNSIDPDTCEVDGQTCEGMFTGQSISPGSVTFTTGTPCTSDLCAI